MDFLWLKSKKELEERAAYYEEQMLEARAERDELEIKYQELRLRYKELSNG